MQQLGTKQRKRPKTTKAPIHESKSKVINCHYTTPSNQIVTSDGKPSNEMALKKLEHTERAIENVETLNKQY